MAQRANSRFPGGMTERKAKALGTAVMALLLVAVWCGLG